MKTATSKVILRMFLLALSCIGLQLGNSQSAMAQEHEEHDKGCSNATLKGTYVFEYNGWYGANSGKYGANGERKPIAYAGQESYDGDGTVTGVATYSVDGAITRNESFTGTYTVKSDCTASVQKTTEKNVITNYAVYLPSGGGGIIFFAQTDPGAVAAGMESPAAPRVKN